MLLTIKHVLYNNENIKFKLSEIISNLFIFYCKKLLASYLFFFGQKLLII